MNETRDETSPEFARGWTIVLVAAIGVGLGSSPLPFFTIGVTAPALIAEFNWTRAQTAGMMTFFTFGSVVGAPIAGFLMDRWGVRRVALASLGAFAIGLASLGMLSAGLTSYYAIAFLTAVAAAGTLPVLWSRLIFGWFTVRRGLAMGLALTGTGLSAAFLSQYATFLVETYGWRWTYVGLAALPGLIALPAAYFLLREASHVRESDTASTEKLAPSSASPLADAMRTYRFWVIGIGLALVGLGIGGIIPHLVPMLIDRGYTPAQAASVASAQGLALIFGRIAAGYLLDRFWPPGVAACVLGIPAIACIILAWQIGGPGMTTLAAVMVGFVAGAEIDILGFLAGYYFRLKSFGRIYGALYAVFVIAAGTAPTLFGWAFDTMGSYRIMLQIAAGCFVLGAAMQLTLGRRPAELAAQPA